MEKEFLRKAKAAGLPQNLIEIGLDNLKLMADAGVAYPVDEEIKSLLEAWEHMPVY